MKVAVTGASGFVGRHVVAALARMADVDLVTTRIDLHGPVAGAFDRLGRPDVVVHLAWSGLPNYRSRAHYEVELPAQYHFLRELIGDGLPALVVSGTCAEYGRASGELLETDVPDPITPYAYAKYALLRQLAFLQRDHAVALTWARLFYTFGDGQAASAVYSQLAAAAARGDAAFAMSAGDQVRDYLPIEIMAELLARLAVRGADDGVVNICSGRPRPLREIVEQWRRQNQWPIDLDLGRLPYAPDEPHAFWGSTRKLATLVGTPEATSASAAK